MKILSILETPYRGTIEEQDDAALWFTHAVKNASDHQFAVLLRGSAVNYAVKNQDPSGMVIGGVEISRPCRPQTDLATMKNAQIGVMVVREDLEQHGISPDSILVEAEVVARDKVASLVAGYDQVWHW